MTNAFQSAYSVAAQSDDDHKPPQVTTFGVSASENNCPEGIYNELTVSGVKSDGSSDILATARVASFPTRALYGASFP